jgi:GT2 family glycosyltransferase
MTGASPSHLVISTSADLSLSRPDAVVCVPTYKRPALLTRTLASLLAQDFSGRAAIVVVDNDGAGREGSTTAARVLAEAGVTHAVLVEPRQGNCKAYNAAWSYARQQWPDTPFLCGIDDDEEALPVWLSALVDAANLSGADIVGGPVTPIFEALGKEWLKAHPIFRSHFSEDGPVPQLWSSANYLIRAGVLDRMGYPYLDEAFDFTGGGDSDFFARARAAGIRFHWASAAGMTETMPARRTERDWIRARALRNGMISALIARKADPSALGRTRTILKSLALLAASPLRGAVDLARTGSTTIALYHAQVALGRLGAEFGLSIEQYRKPEAN